MFLEYKLKMKSYLATICIGKLQKVPGKDAAFMPCDSSQAGSGWTVDWTVNFNRNWADYRLEFGDKRGEFFTGPDKLHRMTKSQNQEFYIYLRDFEHQVQYDRYSKLLIRAWN